MSNKKSGNRTNKNKNSQKNVSLNPQSGKPKIVEYATNISIGLIVLGFITDRVDSLTGVPTIFLWMIAMLLLAFSNAYEYVLRRERFSLIMAVLFFLLAAYQVYMLGLQ